MDERVFEEVLSECLVEEYFEGVSKLRETITGLEGRPMEPIPTRKYDEWFDSLRNCVWQHKVRMRLENIERHGRYGKNSHKCRSKNDIYEIVFEKLPIRIYFTVLDDKRISLEGGSSKKDGSGYGGQQDRVIDAIDKSISLKRKLDEVVR